MEIEKLLENKKYEELLDIAKDENESLYFKALINFDKNEFEICLETITLALSKSNKYYYELVILKLKTLEKLGRFSESLNIVEEELSMPYIPTKYNENFLQIKQEIKQALNPKEQISFLDKASNEELGDLLLSTNDEELLLAVCTQLEIRNIRFLLNYIKRFLILDKSEIIKCVLLDLLNLQGINEEIEIIKNDTKMSVNPLLLEPILSLEVSKKVPKIIEEIETTNNIVLQNQAINNAINYVSKIYPIEIDESEYIYIAIASLIKAKKSLFLDDDTIYYLNKYNLNKKLLDQYIQ